MRILGKQRLTATLLGVSALFAVAIVAAHTYPGTNDGEGADNRNHWGCWVPNPGGGIPLPLWDHLFDYMDDIESDIDFFVFWDNPCNTATDMWLDDRLNNGNIGQRFCMNYNSAGECDRNSVMQDPGAADTAAAADSTSSYNGRRHSWCHEIGHSMGLGHPTGGVANDCMTSGDMWRINYSTHNQNHLENDFVDL